MKRFILSPAAQSDIADIQDYISIDSPAAAVAVTRRIRAAVRLIAESPGIGHLHSDLADEALRVWPEGPYLIVYRLEARPLEIA